MLILPTGRHYQLWHLYLIIR